MTRAIACTLLVVLCLGLTACGESEEVDQIKEGLSHTWDGVKGWTAKKRDEAEAFFSKSVEGMEAKLAAAKEEAAALGGEAGAELETKWADVSTKLGELKSASTEEWGKARDAFVAAYEAFRQELKESGGS